MEPGDYTIDRSEEQKRLRLKQLRAELLTFGYSSVKTEYLHALIDIKRCISASKTIAPLKHCDDAAVL